MCECFFFLLFWAIHNAFEYYVDEFFVVVVVVCGFVMVVRDVFFALRAPRESRSFARSTQCRKIHIMWKHIRDDDLSVC